MSLIAKVREFFSKGQTDVAPLPPAEPPPAGELATVSQAISPFSAQQVLLVQSTWQHVMPIADQAASLFYGKLFELDPDLKPLFANTDMQVQQAKLMQMLTVAVNGLTHLDKIVPTVQELGQRHVAYGAQEAYYDTVGAALLWTLEQGLGERYTPEVQEAWTVTYTTLTNTMKEAAAEMSVH